jgi:hypothetical protein
MRRRFPSLAVANVVLALAVADTSSRAATRFHAPLWLVRAEQSLLARDFAGARPERTYYIPYPRKIAVIFEFAHPVRCGLCPSLSSAPPLVRMVRVSFDRRTHRLGGARDGFAIRVCEVLDNRPPRANCLHR